MAVKGGWAPEGKAKKTSIGNSKNTKYKSKNSGGTVPKGYRKRYRGQGKAK
jgi:acetyl-CoA carboxylase alpha subunit